MLSAIAASLIVLGTWNGPLPASCEGAGLLDSGCGVTNTGTTVEISAESNIPEPATPEGPTISVPPPPAPLPTCAPGDLCRPTYSVSVLPDVYASDLESFRPQTAEAGSEPDGLGISGLPVNLLATAGTHVLEGSLLDYEVAVRFTPIGFTFDHGDGTVTRSAGGGTSWRTLGVPDFTPTHTSHVYRQRGTYTARVSVEYAADVDFGSGRWRPVIGTVTSAPQSTEILILDMTTALVQDSCLEDPSGPGC